MDELNLLCRVYEESNQETQDYINSGVMRLLTDVGCGTLICPPLYAYQK